MRQKAHYWFWGLSGFFILFDQILKYIARTNPDSAYYIIHKIFGWEYYANPGIAFGLPFPMLPLVLLTLIIVAGLLYSIQEHYNHPRFNLGAHLVIAGAISNLIDRVLFGITIDYIRLFYSVANIADLILLIGTTLLFTYWGKKHPTCLPQ